jgi:peptidoglycan/LPS O-acetylase OafA/YrhL
LIAYAIWTFAPLRTALLQLHLFNWVWPGPTPVSPHRCDFLPACFWLLLAITGRAPRMQRVVGWLCLTLAVAGAASRVWVGEWREADTVAALALAAGVVLFRRPCSLRPMAWLAPLGTISFGLYIIAAPLQLGQRALFPGFAGSGLTFSVRLVVVVAVVTGAAWLLERRLAPPFGRWIRRLGASGRSPGNSAGGT